MQGGALHGSTPTANLGYLNGGLWGRIMVNSPIVLAHEVPFSIGPVEIRPSTREMSTGGKTAILEPRVMQALVALWKAEGQVVSKDDLVARCWDQRVVGDDAINRVISRLRHNAEVDGHGAFRIETITRVGYRLVDTEAPEARQKVAPVSRRRALAIGGASIAVAGGAFLGWKMLKPAALPPEAQQLYDEGWDAMRESTVDQYANAVAKFRSATEIAPERAELWGGLALAYQLQAHFAPVAQGGTYREKAAAAADRALAIDPDNGDAIAAKAISVRPYRNWQAAEKACRAALARAPNHPALNFALGGILAQVGRARDALPFVQRAVEIEPMAPRFHMLLANTLWDAGRIEEAENAIERAYRLWPRHYAIWFNRYYILTYNGRPQEALAMMADTANRPIGIPDWNFEATGLQAEALANPVPEIIQRAVAENMAVAKRGVGLAEGALQFMAASNRIDDAFAIIDGYYFNRGFTLGGQRYSKEQGMYAGPQDRHTYILFTQRLRNVRQDPRFAALVAELGLEDYWRATNSIPDYRKS